MAAKKAPAKAMTKTEILNSLAEATGVQKKDVSNILEELGNLIAQNLKKSGPGVFNIPGLMKIVVQDKPAKKARKGINPFTGEEMMFKAKPASRAVKIRPLKGLKDMV
jgi:nucleoid DNA-binding protein